MLEYLLELCELQEIDLSIRDQKKHQDAIPAKLKQLDISVNATQEQLDNLLQQRERINEETKSLRALVDAESHKIRKWEARLNDIRNQREYQALARETEGSKRANKEAEEKSSELSKTRATLDEQIENLRIKLKEEQLLCGSERALVEEALQKTHADMQAQVARRAILIPKIPPDVFQKYDAIRHKRLGIGVCPVVNGCCMGCNIKLQPQLYNILQRGASIEQCPSCSRLVFWEQMLSNCTAALQHPSSESAMV